MDQACKNLKDRLDPLFVFWGYGSEHVLGGLQGHIASLGFDTLALPDPNLSKTAEAELLATREFILLTSSHFARDAQTLKVMYPEITAGLAPVEIISRFAPLASIYYPHDLATPLVTIETQLINLFDLVLWPTQHFGYHPRPKQIETVGWIGYPDEPTPSPSPLGPVFLFSDFCTHREKFGLEGTLNKLAPVLRQGVAIKFPFWPGHQEFEKRFSDAGFDVIPAQESTGRTMLQTSVVVSNSISSISVEASYMGRPVINLREPYLPRGLQDEFIAGLAGCQIVNYEEFASACANPPKAPPLRVKPFSNEAATAAILKVVTRKAGQLRQPKHSTPIGETTCKPQTLPRSDEKTRPPISKLSFIICSISKEKLDHVVARIAEFCDIAYEIVPITDARSLCEGYTRGMAQASGDTFVFCHDDIDFLPGANFVTKLLAHLDHFDVVGVAGSNRLGGPMWMASGPGTWAGMVIHSSKGGSYNITAYDLATAPIQPVQALDGVFFATRRKVAEQIGFDAETFDGFHGYDVDFTYRCHQAGLRLGAAKNLMLIHQSGGNFGDTWRQYGRRFVQKFPEFANSNWDCHPKYYPLTIGAGTPMEAKEIIEALLDGRPIEQRNSGSNAWITDIHQANYDLWRKRKSLQEIDGQVLAERMMLTWKSRPLINLVLEVRDGEAALLADTLDSLGTQWYGDWHLTVFAEFPPLSDELAAIPQITWLQIEPAGFVQAFNSYRNKLNGDWLCFLEPGCTLEGHALAYFADAINASAKPRLLYCDEDVHTGEGQYSSPRFKPDWNLEMLRSMYYLGPCLLLEKSAVQACGDIEFGGSAGFYDLALKFAELFDRAQLVHLPEVLVHTNNQSFRDIDAEAELTAVRNHLARMGIDAQVDTGFVSGTQCLLYAPIDEPLVSIIIPTRDQPGYLQHCVDSLLHETSYQNYELIIVDHDSTDPDALEYIGDLPERPELAGRIQCLRTDGPFNWARLANLGASCAKGDFLLFLDNDTEIIQPAWLTHLLGMCQQAGLAAVSPRLSKPDGQFSKLNQLPRILGLGGLAAPIAPEGSSILEPGYCGRLQISQEISALAGSCLLVRRESFTAAGRFDEENTPVYEAALGLCLRLRTAGERLGWTPWVDVVHRGGISRKRLEGELYERGRLTDTALSERDHLLAEHLALLANDPHYHRQLSLQQPFAIEPYAVVDWDTRFHSRLRVLGVPLTSGSGEYRMLAPFRALQKAGLAQCCQVHPVAHKTQRVINTIELARTAPDVLMLQQAIDDTQIGQLKRYRQFNPDIYVTYAVDDVMGNLPRKHYLYNFQAREGKSRMREGLAHCDRLIVSTQPLADYCQNMIDDIVVVPNRLEREIWTGHTSLKRVAKKPRVGWAGAQQHLGDLELIAEVVEALKDEIDWIFMGMCPAFLKPHVREEHPFVPFGAYPAKLASLNLDLAIAPLEQHLFNEGKSNLRLLEYGIMGWPVVCTDIYPYRTNNPPVAHVNNTAAEWIEAIRARIHDLDAAEREGEALRQWVLKHYILEDHLDDWMHAVTPPGWQNRQAAK